MDVGALITPFDGGAGENLRYDLVYDQIKEARSEEDAALSRGVWERDLKKADWSEAQRLCVEALTRRTKDLQIVAWLGDAECHLEKWAGLMEALDLMAQFCQKCWKICYPLTDDGQPDLDFRQRILDWFVTKMEENLLFMPLTKPNGLLTQELDLATWMSALNFDSISRRMRNQGAAEEAEGQITLARFRTLMRQVDVETLQTVQSFVARGRNLTKELESVWAELCQGQEPSLGRFRESLAELDKICQFSLEGRVVRSAETVVEPEPAPPEKEELPSTSFSPTVPEEQGEPMVTPEQAVIPTQDHAGQDHETAVTDRQTAYEAVNDLADYLIQLEPQTPGPYLLKIVSSWNGKSLPEILDDIVQGQTEGHKILKMMANVLMQNRGG